jgi:L-fuculose-phosphate aldolase
VKLSRSQTNKRQAVIASCRKMNALGINQGTSGNISVRDGNGLLITPTSYPYDAMAPEDIVYLDAGGAATGRLDPSSEWRFHLAIMRAKPDVHAIVHAHPNYCTTIAIMGLDIPAIHYMVAIAGGSTIRCAPYATFGTDELSDNAVAALKDRKACLLAHHGLIATGTSLDNAMWMAVEVETLARQFHGVLQLGKPALLSDKEIANVIERMAGYGHKDRPEPASRAMTIAPAGSRKKAGRR